jgi:hypothetical protein
LLTVLAESIDEKSSYDMRQADWGRLGEMDRNHGFFMLFPGCPKENDGKSPRNFQDQGGSSRMTSHGNP